LQAAYERAEAKAASMQQLQDKLTKDVDRLEARRLEVRVKLAEARMQQQMNASGSNDAFRAMEEEANRLLDEAAAIAELSQDGLSVDLDEKFRQLEQETVSVTEKDEAINIEQELFSIKENLKKKE
jgi:phage shock protein A